MVGVDVDELCRGEGVGDLRRKGFLYLPYTIDVIIS